MCTDKKENTMKIKRMSAAIALLATPSIAMADDQWGGFYAGINFGASDADLTSGTAAISDHSAVYGLQAGYYHSLAKGWVFGAELSYDTAEYEGLGPNKDMDTTRFKLKLGYDLGRTLAYGVVGYADVDLGGASEGGATYGIGVGYKATENVILSAEILRDSFDIKSSDMNLDKTSLTFGVSYQF